MSSWSGRLFVAASGAAGLSFLLFAALPDELDVETDIVGYPTFANFSIDRYFWAYGLTVVFFPLVTFGLFLLLERAFAGPKVLGHRFRLTPNASMRFPWRPGSGRCW